jgi:hypothetical protein
VTVSSRIGPAWEPNFYYRTSNVQVLMLAPLKELRSDACKRRRPSQLRAPQVQSKTLGPRCHLPRGLR